MSSSAEQADLKEPLVEESLDWDMEFDVVVMGSGLAGLSAALAAHELGMHPIVLEKGGLVGGGSCYSYGLIWVGMNHIARAAGYADSREAVIEYMEFLGGGSSKADRMLTFVDRSPEALAFFERCGVHFKIVRGVTDHYYGNAPGAVAEGRSVEVDLISGYELGDWRERVLLPPVSSYNISAEELVSWGGMHTSAGWDPAIMDDRRKRDVRGLGVGMVSGFLRPLLERQIPVRTNAAVERLLMEGSRAIGVQTADGQRIGARRGVVIAAGGYDSNPDMVSNYEGLPGFESMFPDTLTGDGMIVAGEQGAAVRLVHNNLQLFLGFRVPASDVSPSSFRLAGIIELCSQHTLVVNRTGMRFANEAYFQSMGPRLREFDGPSHTYRNLPCYLIFDSQYTDQYSFAGLPPGSTMPDWITRADSIEELAGKLGIDAGQLATSVSRFYGFASSGVDADFGRGKELWRLARAKGEDGNPRLGDVARAPFYGIEMHPSVVSSAGLDADVHGRVLNQRQNPIPGLYATGNAAANNEFGAGYQAGLTLASSLTFSYLAARHMAQKRRAG